MINTQSILSGFRAMLGSKDVHFALFIALLFFVPTPTQVYVDDMYNEESMEEKLKILRWYLLFNHLYCGVVILLTQHVSKAYYNFMQIQVCIAAVCQCFTLIWVAQTLFVNDKLLENTVEETKEFQTYTNWLVVELWALIAVFGSNSAFLLVRSQVQQKLTLEIEELYTTEITDFLQSQQSLMSIINTLMSPVFILFGMRYNLTADMLGYSYLNFELYFASIQAFAVFYLIFVNYHESIDCFHAVWIKVGPLIHAFLTILAFFVIPLTNICSMIAKRKEFNASMFTGSLYVYPIISVAILIEFFIQILPVF